MNVTHDYGSPSIEAAHLAGVFTKQRDYLFTILQTVGPHVDDDHPRAEIVASDQSGSTNGGNQYVGPAAGGNQVTRP